MSSRGRVLVYKRVGDPPPRLTLFEITKDKPNEIYGEVDLEIWDKFCDLYNEHFRPLEKELLLNIETNAKKYGKPIATDRLKGTIYAPLEEKPEDNWSA